MKTYAVIEFCEKEVEICFEFEFWVGAPSHQTWNGWQPEEPDQVEISDAWFVFKDGQTEEQIMVPMPEQLVGLLDRDAHEKGYLYEVALDRVADGP